LTVVQVIVLTVLGLATQKIALTYKSAIDEDKGFDSDLLVTVEAFPASSYAHRLDLDGRLFEAIRSSPSVTAVSRTSTLPPDSQSGSTGNIRVDGTPRGRVKIAQYRVASEFFDVMRLPILEGHADWSSKEDAAVIDERLARRLWRDQSAIGAQFRLGRSFTVVGVVAAARLDSDTTDTGLDLFPVYLALPPEASELKYLVRLTNPLGAAAITTALRSAAPDMRIVVQFVDDRYAALHARVRLAALVSISIAVIAVLVGLLGVYALTAFVCASRTRELSLRLALGASREQLLIGITRAVFWPVALAVGIGAILTGC
jgi:hypothetical protein